MKVIETEYHVDIYPFLGPDDEPHMHGRLEVFRDTGLIRVGFDFSTPLTAGMIETIMEGMQKALEVSTGVKQ